MKSRQALLVLSLFAPLTALSDGSSIRGGGDEVALQFQQAFATAYAQIQTHFPDVKQLLGKTDLAAVAKNATVIVVDTSLSVTKDGQEQYSVAENDPAKGLILINRTRWNAISDPHLREAMAVHEVSSLAKIESTGSYPVSAKYLSHFNSLSLASVQPARSDCSAPKSEGTSCAIQRPDVEYYDWNNHTTLLLEDKSSGHLNYESADGRGQEIAFYDENKGYYVNFSNTSENGIHIGLQIATEQPTGTPNLMLRKMWIKTFSVKDRRIDSQTGEFSFLKASLGGDRYHYDSLTHPDPSEDVYSQLHAMSFDSMETFLSDGTESFLSQYPSLNFNYQDDWVLHSLVVADIFKPVAPMNLSDALGNKPQNGVEKFKILHLSVLQTKTALNQCMAKSPSASCTDLRQLYEKADKDRDLRFKALISASDLELPPEPSVGGGGDEDEGGSGGNASGGHEHAGPPPINPSSCTILSSGGALCGHQFCPIIGVEIQCGGSHAGGGPQQTVCKVYNNVAQCGNQWCPVSNGHIFCPH